MTPSLIEAIKECGRSLLELVEHHVRLRRVGRNRVGLCPFHKEKTPSFTLIGPLFEHFHCFGCGIHGDVLDFQANINGTTTKDAHFLSRLATDLGIRRNNETPAQRDAHAARRKEERLLNEEADRFWLLTRLRLARIAGALRRADRKLSEASAHLINTDASMDAEFAAFKASSLAVDQADRQLEALDHLERDNSPLASERIILGILLSGSVKYAELAAELQPAHFVSNAHRLAFEAMASLVEHGERINRGAVTRELLKSIDPSTVGPFVRKERQQNGTHALQVVLCDFLVNVDGDLPSSPEADWQWRASLVRTRRRATADLYLQFAKSNPTLRSSIRRQMETDTDDTALVVAMLSVAEERGPQLYDSSCAKTGGVQAA